MSSLRNIHWWNFAKFSSCKTLFKWWYSVRSLENIWAIYETKKIAFKNALNYIDSHLSRNVILLFISIYFKVLYKYILIVWIVTFQAIPNLSCQLKIAFHVPILFYWPSVVECRGLGENVMGKWYSVILTSLRLGQ